MPRPKEFTVGLSAADRARPTKVVSSGPHPARTITRARVLLALDESQGSAPDRRVVAERVGTSEARCIWSRRLKLSRDQVRT